MSRLEPFDVTFFAAPDEFRASLEAHHAAAPQLWVGFHRISTGRPSLTWPQSVDQALCYGWIDGIRKSLDDQTYAIRFTPRRKTSTWSGVNLRRVPELVAAGLMRPAGLRAYEERDRRRDGIYSYENRPRDLAPDDEAALRADTAAWAFFAAQPAGYRRTAAYWVTSAKQEATRRRRLEKLIADSAAGRRVGVLVPPGRARPASGSG